MKYLTKQWYDYSQKASLNVLLKPCVQAAVYSDEFFQNLYADELQQWVKLQEEVYNMNPEEYISEEIILSPDVISAEELKILNEENSSVRAKAIDKFNNREPFDEEQVKTDYEKRLHLRIAELQKALPVDILIIIPDIRVLALDWAAEDNLKIIENFCEICQHQVEQASKEYNEHYKSIEAYIPDKIKNSLNLHDCRIIDVHYIDGNLILDIDSSGGFTRINKITFENCNVILQTDIIGAIWLYSEIYMDDGKYEIHVLLTKMNELQELIISTSDIDLYLFPPGSSP